MISKEEAVAAIEAAAFEERIHTFSGRLGADWPLTQALECVENAESLAWINHPLGHDLEALSGGRLIYFAARWPT